MASKFNPIYRIQCWLDSVSGQTFLNYAYAWGAAVVILGALFKIVHLTGANTMLIIGMGTEVVVFFLQGFDRPFDKNAAAVGGHALVSDSELSSREHDELISLAQEKTAMLEKMLQHMDLDGEQAKELVETLTAMRKIYELMLRGSSKTLSSLDEVEREAKIMSENMKNLNNIYSSIIDAHSVSKK